MAEKKSHSVGESIDVSEGAEVERPTGERVRVVGGTYVLDVPGVHLVNGEAVKVA